MKLEKIIGGAFLIAGVWCCVSFWAGSLFGLNVLLLVGMVAVIGFRLYPDAMDSTPGEIYARRYHQSDVTVEHDLYDALKTTPVQRRARTGLHLPDCEPLDEDVFERWERGALGNEMNY